MQNISVSGFPGSGTSTACRLLSARLGWRYVNAGEVFRQLAGEAEVSLAEFSRQAEQNEQIDRQLDERMVEIARSQEGVILEGRLTGWMVRRYCLEALTVWLQAAPKARAARLARRDRQPPGEALKAMVEREDSECRRYRAFYGIQLEDLSIYDLVIDTETHSPKEIVEQIITCLSPRKGG